MKQKIVCAALACALLAGGSWTTKAAEPSFELTARYILEVVKAFRTAYVLKVVEHAREGGIKPNEEWQKDSHFIPLPAQFVKAAADQVDASIRRAHRRLHKIGWRACPAPTNSGPRSCRRPPACK